MEVGSTEEKSELVKSEDPQIEPLAPCDPKDSTKPTPFDFITENVYITERGTSREGKRNKRMMCDCQFDPECDDMSDACGDSCLNRLLMIECGSRCPCGEYCNNKRFQRAQYASVNVFRTEMKGWGLETTQDIRQYSFVIEYCGEVCTLEEFEIRRKEYEKDKRRHYYFMSLKADEILDATRKGNLSRFINHSCDPNCETQKWTVNGKLRVGFFALKNLFAGDELTFDYQFQRFGEAAQKCFCGSDNCRGYLGATKQSDSTRDNSVASGEVKGGRSRRPKGGNDSDSVFEREVYDIVGGSWRLRDIEQVLSLSRLMLRADTIKQRLMILRVLRATSDTNCFKRFLSLHGLRLIWSWMVEISDHMTREALEIKKEILQTLGHIPIPNRNLLSDCKVLQVVEKWSEPKLKLTTPTNQNEESTVTISEADCCIDPHIDSLDSEVGVVKHNKEIRIMELLHESESKVGVFNEMSECDVTNVILTDDSNMGDKMEESNMGVSLDVKKEMLDSDITDDSEEFTNDEADLSDVSISEAVEEGVSHKGGVLDESMFHEGEVPDVHLSDEGVSYNGDMSDVGVSHKEEVSDEGVCHKGELPDAKLSDERELDKEKVSVEDVSHKRDLPEEGVSLEGEVDLPEEDVTHEGEVDLPEEGVTHEGEVDLSEEAVSHEGEVDLPEEAVSHKGEMDLSEEAVSHEGEVDLSEEAVSHEGEMDLSEEAVSHEGEVDLPEEGATHEGEVDLPEEAVSHKREESDDRKVSEEGVSHNIDNISCEAEAIETTIDDKVEDVLLSIEEEVMSLSLSLIEKWKSLEEVFRIPKKVIPKVTLSPAPAIVDDERVVKRQRSNHEEFSSKKRYKKSSRWENVEDPLLSRVKDNTRSSPTFRTSPLPNPHFVPKSVTGPLPSLLSVPSLPPLHNTVIVQQQMGQSVYVQQQIYPGTINPSTQAGIISTQCIPQTPVTMTTGHVPQQFLPSLQPLPVTQTSSPLFPFVSTSSSTPSSISVPLSTHQLSSQPVGVAGLQLTPLPPPPPKSGSLPVNWKEAKDQAGKVYYYHVITRKTQWDFPSDVDKEGEIMMDLATPDNSFSEHEDEEETVKLVQTSGYPRTPEDSPPSSSDESSPNSELSRSSSANGLDQILSIVPPSKPVKRKHKMSTPKDVFRHSLSRLIVHCLDHHRKPECKYGRITCSGDFKHLARKLTFGLTEKEISRKGSSSELVFTDSVKSRVKDYIKSYMKKFGPVYKRS